jgi:8-hydroxy-5-deazaflavin:NADPH oxidoreductase
MIAVIGGTGHQGLGLALRWVEVGIPVVIGSRSLDRAQAAALQVESTIERLHSTIPSEVRASGGRVPSTGVHVEGMENSDAAAAAEVVVVTVPAAAHRDTLAAVAKGVSGKIVVDVTVPLDKNPAYAVQLPEGSAAEAAQRFFGSEVRVVAAFHTVPATLLRDLARPVDCDVLVCGDDSGAKARVIELSTALGARAVDVGALRQAHTLERLTALLIGTGRRTHRTDLGVKITGL